MYQYRNLPPRHQPPGFYPPHQPSLRHQNSNNAQPYPHALPPHQTPPPSMHYYHPPSHSLTRSHSHGMVQSPPRNGYRTHHVNPARSPHKPHVGHSPQRAPQNEASAAYAMQQLQRIKAATACQIINNRVVEAIRQQQHKKKLALSKRCSEQASANTSSTSATTSCEGQDILQAQQTNPCDETTDETGEEESATVSDLGSQQPSDAARAGDACGSPERMTIPQLEISTAPNSTANMTNLSEEELKLNPELYKMYSHFLPFARSEASASVASTQTSDVMSSPPRNRVRRGGGVGYLSEPRRVRRPPLQGHYTYPPCARSTAHRAHSLSPVKTHRKAKLVPIGKVKPNPLEASSLSSMSTSNSPLKRKPVKSSPLPPQIAPAHANVQTAISPNGGIYHPCHGYSDRKISIFDLFPCIVKYQSKKFSGSDRVDYLLSLSETSFCSVNKHPLNINEPDMWYTALKYLFNDITLGQFDYMSVEMRYIIKQYMSVHKSRCRFLHSIRSFGFLRVISDISKKLPRDHIRKVMKQEEKRAKQLEQQRAMQQMYHQQLATQSRIYEEQIRASAHKQYWGREKRVSRPVAAGERMKRTVSEPLKAPLIEDEDDGSWDFITEIVDQHKILPDLPPERKKEESEVDVVEDVGGEKKEEDVYSMLYETMKEADSVSSDECGSGDKVDGGVSGNVSEGGLQVTMEQLTSLVDCDRDIKDTSFTPKVKHE